MGGRRDVFFLGNNAFGTISKLKISEINLEGLNIKIIGKETFSELTTLKKIILNNNPELGIHLADVPPPFFRTSMTVLRLNNVGLFNYLDSSKSVLEAICKLPLEVLTLDNNNLARVDFKPKDLAFHLTFNECFPKLQILTLSYNYLIGMLAIILDIMKLKHLVGFNFSNQISLPHPYSQNYVNSDMNPELKDSIDLSSGQINHRPKRRI